MHDKKDFNSTNGSKGKNPGMNKKKIPGQSMWDLWWTKWHWNRFSPSTSVFPYQFHSTGAPLHAQTKKKTNFYHRVAQ
jgi:hypothetical protein